MNRPYIPARTPEPVWTADRVADFVAVLAILVIGAWLVGKATFL